MGNTKMEVDEKPVRETNQKDNINFFQNQNNS